jgi:hypothetical protein
LTSGFWCLKGCTVTVRPFVFGPVLLEGVLDRLTSLLQITLGLIDLASVRGLSSPDAARLPL